MHAPVEVMGLGRRQGLEVGRHSWRSLGVGKGIERECAAKREARVYTKKVCGERNIRERIEGCLRGECMMPRLNALGRTQYFIYILNFYSPTVNAR